MEDTLEINPLKEEVRKLGDATLLEERLKDLESKYELLNSDFIQLRLHCEKDKGFQLGTLWSRLTVCNVNKDWGNCDSVSIGPGGWLIILLLILGAAVVVLIFGTFYAVFEKDGGHFQGGLLLMGLAVGTLVAGTLMLWHQIGSPKQERDIPLNAFEDNL